ncbi:MAG: anthranilate phosphoribosyltransferase [Planctomycetales bacterium]|nr:anthranilate phosphoribosyltransferase [Planctomycetales bacterium]
MNEHEFNVILSTLQSRQDLSPDQMRATVGWLLSGSASSDVIRQLLELMAEKGESVGELVGAARALRDSMLTVATDRPVVVDTCGTGGDGSKTFNISTAAALVAAAAGVPVAKHGNRKITSSTGSADVLGELGINLEAEVQVAARCLREIGICFCFAPYFHPAMRHVGPARREVSRPTIFNRLGPLANPAGANCQVLGTGDTRLQDKLAQALLQLGTRRSIVVCGSDGVDEISLSAPTRILVVENESIAEAQWQPSDFGIQRAARDDLFADSPSESAVCIRSVLDGQLGPKRDVVVLNAAAALWVFGSSTDLQQCAQQACEAIDDGRAQGIVERLAALTNAPQ